MTLLRKKVKRHLKSKAEPTVRKPRKSEKAARKKHQYIHQEKVVDTASIASNLPAIIPSKELQLFRKESDLLIHYRPSKCKPNSANCSISKKGSCVRSRCFDNDGPFELVVPRFYCHRHKHTVSTLDTINEDVQSIPQIIVFPRTVITKRFAMLIFQQAPHHYFNFAAMKKGIEEAWRATFNSKVEEAILLNQLEQNSASYALLHDKWSEMATISEQFVEDIYTFAMSKAQPQIQQYIDDIFESSGTVLRLDHTYKVTQNISAYSATLKCRMQIKASLCSVLNEHGHVLVSKVVPSDERIHVENLMRSLWYELGEHTTHVFTDDSRKDRACIGRAWKDCNSSKPPSVCQDVWHAQQRIVKAMNRRHPDFKLAKSQLSTVFGTITGTATSNKQFRELVNAWSSRFQKRSAVLQDDELILSVASKLSKRKYSPSSLPIVTEKVQIAVANLLKTQYLTDLKAATSLTEYKQGTSHNEAWHKFLKRHFVQYSGSVSIELVKMAILHLQFLFNRGKDQRSEASPTDIQFCVNNSIQRATVDHSHLSAENLIAKGFRFKRRAYDIARAQDVQMCRIHVQQILLQKESINHSLIHELTHYRFANQFSKEYVRLLLHELKRISA